MELSILLAVAVAVAVVVLVLHRAAAKRRARGVWKKPTSTWQADAPIAPRQAPAALPQTWTARQEPAPLPRQMPVAPPPQSSPAAPPPQLSPTAPPSQSPAASPNQPRGAVVQRRKEPRFELVPHWMGNINARALLPEEVWEEISRQVRASHGWQCRECHSGTNTECHEVWKYEWVWRPGRPRKVGVMRLKGLQTLCRLCHRGKHFKWAESQGELVPVKAHLMALYALSEADWNRLVRAALDNKELKYKYEELDLTYLNDDRFAWVHARIGRKFTENEMPYIEQQ